MSTIKVHNFLDGKNICNIFANLIVNKINDSFPDAKTEITVTNVGNFFVVKGKTSSDILINIAPLFQEFLNKYDEEKSKRIRVIDTILYNTDMLCSPINVSIKKDKLKSERKNNLKKLLNKYAKQKIYLNIEINDTDKILFYDCSEENLGEVKNVLNKHFSDYQSVKYDFSSDVYVSDKIYGSSMHDDKVYFLLLTNISNHLFNMGISNKLHITLHTSYKISEINRNNIFLNIENNEHIVKKSWLESLILDIFPFDYKSLSKRFNDSHNLVNTIINCESTPSVYKLHEISEIVLF